MPLAIPTPKKILPFSPPNAPEPRFTQSGPLACSTWLDISGPLLPPQAMSPATTAIPRIFFTVCPSVKVLEPRMLFRDERCREVVSRAESRLARRGLLRCLWSAPHSLGLLLRRRDYRAVPGIQSTDVQSRRSGHLGEHPAPRGGGGMYHNYPRRALRFCGRQRGLLGRAGLRLGSKALCRQGLRHRAGYPVGSDDDGSPHLRLRGRRGVLGQLLELAGRGDRGVA